MTTARDSLLAELLAGEDPTAPEYADARARLDGPIAAVEAAVDRAVRQCASGCGNPGPAFTNPAN